GPVQESHPQGQTEQAPRRDRGSNGAAKASDEQAAEYAAQTPEHDVDAGGKGCRGAAPGERSAQPRPLPPRRSIPAGPPPGPTAGLRPGPTSRSAPEQSRDGEQGRGEERVRGRPDVEREDEGVIASAGAGQGASQGTHRRRGGQDRTQAAED